MRIIAITTETPQRRELELFPALLEAGVHQIHVRWPGASREQMAEALLRVCADARRRLVVHSHHDLAGRLGLGGCHWRSDMPHPEGTWGEGFRSRSCHSAEEVRAAWGSYDRVVAAPVFASLSKPGHAPVVGDWGLRALAGGAGAGAGKRASVACALGGVAPGRLRPCAEQGFGEAAVLGALWTSPDPLATAVAFVEEAEGLT